MGGSFATLYPRKGVVMYPNGEGGGLRKDVQM